MENNSRSCPWGDCPALNTGPKSLEHELRYKQIGEVRQTAQNSTATAVTDAVGSKHAK